MAREFREEEFRVADLAGEFISAPFAVLGATQANVITGVSHLQNETCGVTGRAAPLKQRVAFWTNEAIHFTVAKKTKRITLRAKPSALDVYFPVVVPSVARDACLLFEEKQRGATLAGFRTLAELAAFGTVHAEPVRCLELSGGIAKCAHSIF